MKSLKTDILTPTPFQARVLALPEKLDGAPLNILLAGGRGGGKSKLIQMILLRYCMDSGSKARALITRRRLKSMMQLQVELQELLQVAFGSVRWNQQTTSFTLPTGGTITLGCLDDRNLSDFSGLNVGMMICDEAGHSPTPETLAELMLTLRLEPMRAVLAANPGGKEHGNIVRRWLQHPDWKPFRDQAGLLWVNSPSTSKDNPHIDPVAYKKMFQAMRGMDPGRADAMEFGSWRLHGDFFAAWGPHLVYDHTEMPPEVFSPIVSIDPGSYAPTAVTLCGWTTDDVRLRDDRVIPRKSFIVHDSIYEFDEINQNLARGSGRSPKEIAPRIRSMLIRNYANDTTLISDPAGGARVAGRLEPSIIQLYKQAGIPMRPAPRTRRVDGWTKMRELMRDGMFWVASRNIEWLDTVPGLPRSPHDAEDLDTDSVDHLADSTRYALLSQGTQIRSGSWK